MLTSHRRPTTSSRSHEMNHRSARTCTGADLADRLADSSQPRPEPTGHGGFSRQHVQTARGPRRRLDGCSRKQGSAPPLPVGRSRSDPNPGGMEQVVNIDQTIVPGVVTNMRYRSQNPLNNRTRGSNWIATAALRDRLARRQDRLPG